MADWGCNWEGSPVLFENCLLFNIATANKLFKRTAADLVPMCNPTMKNVRILNAPCRHKKRSMREGERERERERVSEKE